jgi:Leucine-rich repeat (LRR) protein
MLIELDLSDHLIHEIQSSSFQALENLQKFNNAAPVNLMFEKGKRYSVIASLRQNAAQFRHLVLNIALCFQCNNDID